MTFSVKPSWCAKNHEGVFWSHKSVWIILIVQGVLDCLNWCGICLCALRIHSDSLSTDTVRRSNWNFGWGSCQSFVSRLSSRCLFIVIFGLSGILPCSCLFIFAPIISNSCWEILHSLSCFLDCPYLFPTTFALLEHSGMMFCWALGEAMWIW